MIQVHERPATPRADRRRLGVQAAWLVLVLASAGAADATADDVSVRVVDATTSAPVTAATVTVDGRTLTADANGRCALVLAPGPWSLEVRASGYSDRRVPLQVTDAGPAVVEVALVRRDRFREQVDVSAPTGAAEPAKVPVKPAEVVGVAGGIENIFHVSRRSPVSRPPRSSAAGCRSAAAARTRT